MDFKNNKTPEFEILNEIKEVEVSASFKSSVLEKIEEKKESNVIGFNWFTPKYQIAAMIVVLLVNTLAIAYAFSYKETESLESLQEQYISRSNYIL